MISYHNSSPVTTSRVNDTTGFDGYNEGHSVMDSEDSARHHDSTSEVKLSNTFELEKKLESTTKDDSTLKKQGDHKKDVPTGSGIKQQTIRGTSGQRSSGLLSRFRQPAERSQGAKKLKGTRRRFIGKNVEPHEIEALKVSAMKSLVYYRMLLLWLR